MDIILSKRASRSGRLVVFGLLVTFVCALSVSAVAKQSSSAKGEGTASGYIAEGQQLLDHGSYRGAITEFNRALLLDPSSEEAKRGIIKAYQELSARSATPDALAIEGERINAHLTKGTEYYDAEKPDEAIAEWQEVLRIDSENKLALSLIDAAKRAKVDMLIEKGHDEYFVGDYDKAIAIWEDAMAIVPASKVLETLLREAREARHEREAIRNSDDLRRQFNETDEYVYDASTWPADTGPGGIKWKDISLKPKPEKYREFGTRADIMKELTQPVAFEFECEPLREVLRFLTTITGINILIDEEVFDRFGFYEDCYGSEVDRAEIFITIHVSELPLESALNGMFRQHGLGYSIQRDFVYISTPDILRGSSFEQLETRFYHLRDTSRISLPKLDVTAVAPSTGSESTLDLSGGQSIISSISEIRGNTVQELDADYEAMSVPRLVSILRTFIPTVVDQSKSEDTKKRKILKKDKIFGGMKSGSDQRLLFEAPRTLWSDYQDREILSIVEFDAHTNTLIVRNTPTNLDMVEIFLDHLDREPRQVAVEAKFLTYSMLEMEKVGVNFTIGGLGEGGTLEKDSAFSDSTTVNFGFGSLIGETLSGIVPETIGRGGDILLRFTKDDGDFLEATFDMLSELKNTRTISAPRLVTLHNKPAVISDIIIRTFRTNIEITSNVVTPDTGPATTSQSITQEFQDVNEGITLSITPQIQPDGTIRLFILPSISVIEGTVEFEVKTSDGEGGEIINIVTRPEIVIQSLFTNLVINDGDTIVIGGLIDDVRAQQVTGIPFLKDIPLIGGLFENETEITDTTNLLIFITVNIMDPQGVAYTRLK